MTTVSSLLCGNTSLNFSFNVIGGHVINSSAILSRRNKTGGEDVNDKKVNYSPHTEGRLHRTTGGTVRYMKDEMTRELQDCSQPSALTILEYMTCSQLRRGNFTK